MLIQCQGKSEPFVTTTKGKSPCRIGTGPVTEFHINFEVKYPGNLLPLP